MKKTEPGHAVALVLVAAFSLALAGACSRPQRRTDWRSPSPPAACTSDADCPGGACAIELGASQGSCGPASPLHPAVDAGAPGVPTHPAIQPSPGDIQI
jgi:hypothetical protein